MGVLDRDPPPEKVPIRGYLSKIGFHREFFRFFSFFDPTLSLVMHRTSLPYSMLSEMDRLGYGSIAAVNLNPDGHPRATAKWVKTELLDDGTHAATVNISSSRFDITVVMPGVAAPPADASAEREYRPKWREDGALYHDERWSLEEPCFYYCNPLDSTVRDRQGPKKEIQVTTTLFYVLGEDELRALRIESAGEPSFLYEFEVPAWMAGDPPESDSDDDDDDE